MGKIGAQEAFLWLRSSMSKTVIYNVCGSGVSGFATRAPRLVEADLQRKRKRRAQFAWWKTLNPYPQAPYIYSIHYQFLFEGTLHI